MDEHTLNDLLECSVCLERLDTSSKVLPCQHTFCRKCLEVIHVSRKELRCPECRILVDTKIEDLPPNVLLMRILEGMKNAASKHHIIINDVTSIKKEIKQSFVSSSDIVKEEQIKQQIQQDQVKQRQQQILQFQQNQRAHNKSTTSQHDVQSIQQQTQNLQRRCIAPHAFALYDFESNESTDLKFKKGDLIFLKRKIDTNWYVGQLKECEGNFPINYVQIIVPLPTSQCVALYDFKMGPNEEEGCLSFKKGAVIQVLRRVDHNWAEGRIGTSIGIFPIAFVELNQLAKQLLEGYTIPSITSHHPFHNALQPTNNDVRNLPPLPQTIVRTTNNYNAASTTTPSLVSSTINTVCSSSNSSNAISPTTTSVYIPSSKNATYNSMPNSPQSSKPPASRNVVTNIANQSNTVLLRSNDLKQKRHSLNALLNNANTALSLTQINRHSAEILSAPNDLDNEPRCSTMSAVAQTSECREEQFHTSNESSTGNLHSTTPAASNLQQISRHNVLKTCAQQNMTPSLPWGYLALYPYKPRKSDELELKKGCVYMVTERCVDGWFKGKNWKDISGVFPGNYVTALRARDQQQLMQSWKLIPPSMTMHSNFQSASTVSQNQNKPSTSSAVNHTSQQQLSPSYPPFMRNDLENINARLTLANLIPHQAKPPDLPPRYLTISPAPPSANSNNANMATKENRDKEAQKENPTRTGCISTSSSSSTSSASIGLRKFLTHIKSRSKSPSTTLISPASIIQAKVPTQTNYYPLNQPDHLNNLNAQYLHTEAVNINTPLTPLHIRSGSCPSQLLQNVQNEVHQSNVSDNKMSCSTKNTQQSSPQNNYGPHRTRGPKEKNAAENTRLTIDSTLRSIYANHLQQQSALIANKCAQEYQQSSLSLNCSNLAINHRKSHSLDVSNMLQSSPITPLTTSNNSVGVAVVGGESANIPQSAISTAAIHASATTKYMHNMNESRFRCVVPYPPNSNIELELQVGDIIFVYHKQKNGWYKGTNSRTYKTGLFPASFVETDI